MKDRRNIKFLIIGIVAILIAVIGFSFAFFGANKNIVNTLPVNITIAEGIEANFTVNGNENMALTIDGSAMLHDLANNVAANNSTTLNVTLESTMDVSCTFDIVWEWNASTPNQYTKTTSADNEFTISGTDGTNSFNETQVPNYNNTLTLGSYEIITKNATTTQNWTFNTKFYNLNLNQDNHAGKTYSGKVKIANANCGQYVPPALETITALASETGAGATDGHPGAMVNDEYGIRYIGENPSNFVWFNCSDLTNQNASTCERWRIIGVFNEKYDTDDDNIPDTTGPLIKIIRNDSLGSYPWDYKGNGVGSGQVNGRGSNDWSDSQLMMMLNPPEFLNSGYVSENDVNPVYNWTINNEGYVVSNGINIYRNMGSYFDSSKTAYIPASTSTSGFTSTTQPGATFTRMSTISQSMIATVKWHLTGPNGTNYQSSSNGLASHWYAYERNDPDGTGYVYTGRPKIWYGKVGLMYPSDYGFATSGDASVSGYDRASCLNKELYGWDSGSYQTYCAYKDWLLYVGATGGTSATKGSASIQWTITPRSSSAVYVFGVYSFGTVDFSDTYGSWAARPVLYLKAGLSIIEGSGTYDSPYKLSQ